ncbi:unnamed protein product [Paramecium sonneborni]|uniref:N-acetyltransferase domain-containing protein n=1 Tax=Paramecium sonneborni TaxID=65129 RepID=A0A8S1MCT6_9CILI|nr:unnamed protein product [Paramecium sonneborni]
MQQSKLISISTQKLKFIPYTEEVVETYHKWMQDPEILYLTGSEPLSLEEEYKNQESWLNDPLKHTFIIKNDAMMIGDVNLFFHQYLDDDEAEINVMIGNKNARRQGFAEEAIKMMMSFGLQQYKKTKYIAKIKDSNEGSIKLFQKVGYKEIKKLPQFEEIHLQMIIDAPLIEYIKY